MKFKFFKVSLYYNPWDQGQIGIKLGAKLVIHQKLSNFTFLQKEDVYVNSLESVIFSM